MSFDCGETSLNCLPPELRLQIWSAVIDQPRIVEIRTTDYPNRVAYTKNSLGNRISNRRWRTRNPAPIALSINRESREAALRAYTIRLAPRNSPTGVIYLNPELDVVYINSNYPEYYKLLLDDVRAFDEDEQGLRHLAVPAHVAPAELAYGGVPMAFADLDTLTVVFDGQMQRPDSFRIGRFWRVTGDWDGDGVSGNGSPGGCVFVPPETLNEVRFWEHNGRILKHHFERWMRGKRYPPLLSMVAVRRDTCGGGEKRLGEEEAAKGEYMSMGTRMVHRPAGNG